MNRGQAVAISLLKQASAAEAAGSGAVKLVKAIGKGGLKVLQTGGKLGRGAAKALGAHEDIGTAVGLGATALAGGAAAKGLVSEGKNRVDNWRLQHGLYPTPAVGYY